MKKPVLLGPAATTPALCGLLLFVQVAHGGLAKYSAFVVSGGGGVAHGMVQPDVVRITYLGVNGYRFETADHALLIDPYFSRVGFWSVAFNKPIASIRERVDEGYNHFPAAADAILVTHAHFDHLLDVPDLMHRTGADLFSGPTAINLVQSLGVPAKDCKIVKPGDVRTIGPWTIRVFAAEHDRLFGKVPFNKCRSDRPSPQSSPSRGRETREAAGEGELEKRPVKVSDWCVGEPLAFVIEAAGKRIYIDSGGVPGSPPDAAVGHVDLAIFGVALPDSRRRFAEVVRQLQPRYTLPSHQDDFFALLSRGFVFGKLTNFPQLVRIHKRQELPGRLILLDYFRPWTLR